MPVYVYIYKLTEYHNLNLTARIRHLRVRGGTKAPQAEVNTVNS